MKIIKILKYMVLALVILGLPFFKTTTAEAMEYCKTITYTISDEGVIITGYMGEPEIINLPSQIDGKPVTEIRENAFYMCDTLKEIVIPESVSKIGEYAFFGCTSLETAEINGSENQIAQGLFYGCTNLENIILNISPSIIGDYAFYDCQSISEFKIPSGVVEIGEYCFAECRNLSDIFLDIKLQNLKSCAFYNCTALEKINLPDNLLSIGHGAVGFTENGVMRNTVITGLSDSIAQNYAETNGIKFNSRIRYKNYDTINSATASGILVWTLFAAIYGLLMFALLSRRKI